MKVEMIEAVKAYGFSVRTNNTDEIDPAKAKIGQLWQGFFDQVFPKLTPDSKVYGVYTNYESDFTGEFDVVACTNVLADQNLDDLFKTADNFVETEIQAGKYLTFSAEGELPQAVIDLWGEVWTYFNALDCPHIRAYTTDFEFYKGETEVEISIAIK
ncbi:GyrI-like domain-containing protein [Vibrio splendidus]|uniref:GyrI-like domain-containing protein n=1 Tax=Vibrio splendidus TaxID=29497 RepID=UPI00352FE6E9